MSHHEHLASVTPIHGNYYRPTIAERAMDFVHDHKTATTALVGMGVLAASLAGLDSLKGGSNDPARFEQNPNVQAVHIEEGANLRYDPYVDQDNYIATLGQEVTVTTPGGIHQHEELHNGHWLGVNATDIPNFDAKGDKDGIIWINQQTATEVSPDD